MIGKKYLFIILSIFYYSALITMELENNVDNVKQEIYVSIFLEDNMVKERVITEDLISALNEPQQQYILCCSQSLAWLQEAYEISKRKFKKYGIKKPLQQIAYISKRSSYCYNSMGNAIDSSGNGVTRVTCYKDPGVVKTHYNEILGPDNCKKFEIETASRKSLSPLLVREHLGRIFALHHKGKWYKLPYGLYLFEKDTQKASSPFLIENFTEINPFLEEVELDGKDGENWVDSLNAIFSTNQKYRWSFYFSGHGSLPEVETLYSGFIAGLTETSFSKFLQFCNNNIATKFLLVSSCHTSAQRIHDLTKDLNIPFFNFNIITKLNNQNDVSYGDTRDLAFYYPLWMQKEPHYALKFLNYLSVVGVDLYKENDEDAVQQKLRLIRVGPRQKASVVFRNTNQQITIKPQEGIVVYDRK